MTIINDYQREIVDELKKINQSLAILTNTSINNTIIEPDEQEVIKASKVIKSYCCGKTCAECKFSYRNDKTFVDECMFTVQYPAGWFFT